MTMNELITYFDELLLKLEESGGEITDEIAESLIKAENLFQEKADNIFEYRRNIEDKIDAIVKRTNELNKSLEAHISRLERFDDYVLYCLDRLKKTKIEGNYSSLSYRKPSKRVEILDENKIPVQFVKRKESYSIDKSSILKLLKEGEIIEGVSLVDGPRKLKGKLG